MNYPQIYIPLSITENLHKVFPEPTQPALPKLPTAPSRVSIGSFIAVIFLASIFFFIKLAIIGIIIFGVLLYNIFSNSDKKRYQEQMNKYNSAIIVYNKALKDYQYEITLKSENFQEYKRTQNISRILTQSTNYIENTDYKEGVSHVYFKEYLKRHFGNDIVESTSINSSFYDRENYNLYITDFTYIDKYTHLKIDIEIDEPYTFENKKPIHLNDSARNDFFLKNNWVVVRFAEEQVINHPNECCDLINRIITSFYDDYSWLKSMKSNIPEVLEWNFESASTLVKNNHRDSYLNGKVYFRL